MTEFVWVQRSDGRLQSGRLLGSLRDLEYLSRDQQTKGYIMVQTGRRRLCRTHHSHVYRSGGGGGGSDAIQLPFQYNGMPRSRRGRHAGLTRPSSPLPPLPQPNTPEEFERLIMKGIPHPDRLKRLIQWWDKISRLYTFQFIPHRVVLAAWLKQQPEASRWTSCLLNHARDSVYYHGLKTALLEVHNIPRVGSPQC